MNTYSCFVISPIGTPGSDTRNMADEVLDYLIIPALRNCGFSPENIIRADKLYSSGNINSDIITLINSSDLCIIDVTGKNPNVMYECGMRHSNGKPYIMMVRSGEPLPFDISGLRTIQYDLTSLKKAKESQDILEQFVNGLIETGFAREDGTDSISSMAEILRNIEQKVNFLVNNAHPATPDKVTLSNEVSDILSRLSPIKAFNYALANRDVALAESLLPRIEQQVSKEYYIDHAVVQVAAMGSQIAAMYIKEHWAYISSIFSDEQQYECLGAFVTYCNQANTEETHLAFVDSCIEAMLKGKPDTAIQAGLYNQKNRIYFGAYVTTDRQVLDYYTEALRAIQKAIELDPNKPSFYFNYATIIRNNDINKAAALMEKCIDMNSEYDEDHLELAYKLFALTNNPKATSVLQKLEEINPYLAFMAKRDITRQ